MSGLYMGAGDLNSAPQALPTVPSLQITLFFIFSTVGNGTQALPTLGKLSTINFIHSSLYFFFFDKLGKAERIHFANHKHNLEQKGPSRLVLLRVYL